MLKSDLPPHLDRQLVPLATVATVKRGLEQLQRLFACPSNNLPLAPVISMRFERSEPAMLDQNFGHGICAVAISDGSKPLDISCGDSWFAPSVYKPVKKPLNWMRFVIGRRNDRLQQRASWQCRSALFCFRRTIDNIACEDAPAAAIIRRHRFLPRSLAATASSARSFSRSAQYGHPS